MCYAHLLRHTDTGWSHGHEINAGIQGGDNPCIQPIISVEGWNPLHLNSCVLNSSPAYFLLLAWVVFPTKSFGSIVGLRIVRE